MGQKDLPLASGEEHVKAFCRLGWELCAKTKRKNPHFLLEKDGHTATLSIPAHKEVKRALLASQIHTAGVSETEYLDAFHKRTKKSP
jgi:hypothetical protein